MNLANATTATVAPSITALTTPVNCAELLLAAQLRQLASDRISARRPIGLTEQQTRDYFQAEFSGEVMVALAELQNIAALVRGEV